MRTRGGNKKFRGLRLDNGNFSWGSEGPLNSSFVSVCIESVSWPTCSVIEGYLPQRGRLLRPCFQTSVLGPQ